MVSEYLKKNTADLHDAAEKLFSSDKIFNKTFTFDDYKKIIRNNYLMLLNSENQIIESLSTDFSDKLQLDQRKKLSVIEKDLSSLSLQNEKPEQVVEISNQNEALGMLYVIEGSTLGGNVIAKQLSKTEGFEDVTFNFFGCYKENTGAMWKNFKEVLDTEVKEESYDEVLAGAKKLYTLLLNIN
ncbi:biliverdin-producing heme oxygenase [Chryseobacterium caseinilyticum]|uniref:Biliverdin-producing heme oxygenase n=1 Tax=Chryseobacterium caseinilyticum TaxID=2771428 RepID=A0ABR8Z6I4_9FLAO|nr:biliverdin-producing heme oxygenase [Chryseobacterium caseinilyticum]MBD8080850.1 biliverdin-producing heme oxygenase [Chryseobacterium caseinilyticum]